MAKETGEKVVGSTQIAQITRMGMGLAESAEGAELSNTDDSDWTDSFFTRIAMNGS